MGLWTIKAQGVGESLASLVLRARLILLRSSRDAGGVGGPRAHASRIASTSAFSAAKFRSAVAAGDDSPSAMAAGDCSGPGGDASDARGNGALHVCAERGHAEAADALLALGAPLRRRAGDGLGPLHIACPTIIQKYP